IVAFAFELIHAALDHVANAHDAHQRSFMNHWHVTDSPSRHDPHQIFHAVVRGASPHTPGHDRGHWTSEHLCTFTADVSCDIAFRNDSGDRPPVVRYHQGTDIVTLEQLQQIRDRPIGFDRGDERTLGPKYGGDQHRYSLHSPVPSDP